MDNQNKPKMPADDSWFDELLTQPQVGQELGADEQAVNAAGLTDPADLELEQIILETQNMDVPPLEDSELLGELAQLESAEELPAEIVEEQPVESVQEQPVESAVELPMEIVEELTVESAQELTMESAQEQPVEIADEIPDQVTDETLLNVPPNPAEVSIDATMVHTINPSESSLWELPVAEELPEEEEPRVLPETPFLDDEYRDTFGESGEGLEVVFADMTNAKDLPTKKEPDPKSSRRKPELKSFRRKPDSKPSREKPAPKGRPKMKKGYGLLGIPHVVSTVVWLIIILAIGVSLGRMMWVIATDVLAFGRESKDCVVTISDNDNIDTIANKLKTAGLIKYPELFKFYAELTDAEEEISAGTFTLNTKYDYMALVNYMSDHSSIREEVEVLIPEGYTCAQIFALLEEKKVCTAKELEEYAASGELEEYWFLEDVERGTAYCLEGYLFPDTYKFYTNDKPGRVLSKLLDNFDYRFTDIMKEKLDALNDRMGKVMSKLGYPDDYVQAHKFTLRDIVIIASMVEKETANDSESYDVASVIYNRLTNAKEYPYLNIDATIIYALGGNVDPETGKTKPLTSADLQMDHPYNTYTEKGMIPGPISNPGRNSLYAALDPNETNYYFYVFNPRTGVHLFAKNAKDHQKNVDYVRSLEDKE